MNERLMAYKKQKYKENRTSELNRRYPNGIPSDYNETTKELKREFKRFMEKEKK
jgi:hypothetical protein